MEVDYSGDISIDGQNLTELKERQRTLFRRRNIGPRGGIQQDAHHLSATKRDLQAHSREHCDTLGVFWGQVVEMPVER